MWRWFSGPVRGATTILRRSPLSTGGHGSSRQGGVDPCRGCGCRRKAITVHLSLSLLSLQFLKLAKDLLHTSHEVWRVLLPFWRCKLQKAGARLDEQRVDIGILESPAWDVLG
jgi:hypothetical protein